MFYIYILKSENFNKFYTGYTKDLDRRLHEHNQKKNLYSKRYAPWKIIYTETFEYQEDAIRREKYLKSASGRKWLKKNKEHSSI